MTSWGDASGPFHWEPSSQLEPSLWGEVDTSVGFPLVELAGVDVTGFVVDVAWVLGREWWLAGPTPGTANVQLAGNLAGSPVPLLRVGDPLAIRAYPLGDLWRGWVDAIVETTDPEDGELAYAVSISASDALSRLLSAEVYKSLVLPAQPLDARLRALATAAGVPELPVVILPTSATPGETPLPTLVAVTLTGSSTSPVDLGAHLDDCEKATNAIVAVGRDGSWIIQPRARLVTTPAVVDLDPNHLERALATPDRVRNVFTVAGVETVQTASVGKYGRRAYDVPAGVLATAPPYAPETLVAFATPAPFAVASVPVEARTDPAVLLDPFAYVRVVTRPTDELYQAMQLSWRAEPDAWELSTALDRTQQTIAPPTGTDPPDPLPPEVVTVTTTYDCDRSAYVVRTPGGLNAGNGGSVDLLVGLLGDGNKARGLVRFPLTFTGKNRKVTSAKLRLRVGQTTCSAYGSSASSTVFRCLEGWSSGTFATRCAFSSSNAVVWPGPDVTSTGKVSKAVSESEGSLWEVDVKAMVQAVADGAPNYGFMLRGTSEESSANRVPFWSRNAGSSGNRPQLVVTYTYEK